MLDRVQRGDVCRRRPLALDVRLIARWAMARRRRRRRKLDYYPRDSGH